MDHNHITTIANTTIANTTTPRRIQIMADLFFQGILSMESINTLIKKQKYYNSVVFDFFTYMREHLTDINALKFLNEKQLKIINWLELERCKNKKCNAFNIKVACCVKKSIGGVTCTSCETRKKLAKIDLRFHKKVTNVCCENDEGLLCPICYDNINHGECFSKLPCSHSFHPHCVKQWLINKDTCPTCRYELDLDLLNLKSRNNNKTKFNEKKMRAKNIQREKYYRKLCRRRFVAENLRARANIRRPNGGFYYSNNRGFTYKRTNILFPNYRVVTIVPPRENKYGNYYTCLLDMLSDISINYFSETTNHYQGRIRNYVQSNWVAIDETHAIST